MPHTPKSIQNHAGNGKFGVKIFAAKNEGGNPSGSFKDRGLAAGVAFGRACGADSPCRRRDRIQLCAAEA